MYVFILFSVYILIFFTFLLLYFIAHFACDFFLNVAMCIALPRGRYVEDRILQRRERRLASPGKHFISNVENLVTNTLTSVHF